MVTGALKQTKQSSKCLTGSSTLLQQVWDYYGIVWNGQSLKIPQTSFSHTDLVVLVGFISNTTERETDRDRERQRRRVTETERDGERQTERVTEREREIQRGRQADRQRETETESDRDTERRRETQRERQIQRGGQADRQRQREQRQRQNERQGDRERQRLLTTVWRNPGSQDRSQTSALQISGPINVQSNNCKNKAKKK